MPEDSPPKVVRHEDFENVYDLPDPRIYYRALEPLDYRAPAIVSGYLKTHGSRIAAQRGKARLSVLDFCSGYGANGALLNHALTLEDLFAYYSEEADGEAASQDSDFLPRGGSRSRPSRSPAWISREPPWTMPVIAG